MAFKHHNLAFSVYEIDPRSFNVLILQVIYTRSDGRTVIEIWTNGEQAKGRDQLINPGSQAVNSTSSDPSQKDFLNSNPNVEATTTTTATQNPKEEETISSIPINQLEAKSNDLNESVVIEEPNSSEVKGPSQENEVSSLNPEETQDVFLTKLRSAIR